MLIGYFFFGQDPQKLNQMFRRQCLRACHTADPPRLIHRQGKWLTSHARTKNAKCDSVPFCMRGSSL